MWQRLCSVLFGVVLAGYLVGVLRLGYFVAVQVDFRASRAASNGPSPEPMDQGQLQLCR